MVRAHVDPMMPIVLLLAFRHYGYEQFPEATWGDWYGLPAAACLFAFLAASNLYWPLKAWAMGEEFLTAGCTSAWLAAPEWFTHAFAAERCSSVVGFKIGSVGLMFLALAIFKTAQVSSYVNRGEKTK